MKVKQSAFRAAMLCTAAAVSLGAPSLAHAQQSSSPSQVDVSEIVVTGSRIRRDTFDAPLPLATVSAEAIRASGHTILGDALMEVPMIAPNSNAQNTSSTLFTSGEARVDIRGLGASRTLVLMDSRRIINSDASSPAVDLNTIPSLMIDRVEVQPGGVSAIYGSEAIAGVVNLIMKKSFDGFQLDAQAGETYKSDGQQYIVGAMWGRKFLDDKLSILVGGEFGREDPVFQRDRADAGLYPGIRRDTTPGLIPQPIIPASRSNTVPTALFQLPHVGGVVESLLTPGQIVSLSAACQPSTVLPSCQDPNLFYTAYYNALQNKTTRGTIRGYAEYQLTDHIKAFADVSYARVLGYGFFQPTFSTAAGGGTLPAVLRGDNAFLLTSQTPAAQELRAFWAQAFPVTAANPNPFVRTNSVPISKFWQEFGGRDSETHRSVQRYVVGMEGDADAPFVQNFHWDWYAQEGKLDGYTISYGVANIQNTLNALDATVGPGGTIVCHSGAAGCVPWDIINGASPAAVQYANGISTTTQSGKQDVVSGNVTFDLFKLPAGPVGFAAGVEYRKEQSLFTQDPLGASGALFFNAIGTRGGKFDVTEGYAEVRIPILKDLPFFDDLSIEGAIRESDYSTIGHATQWRGAAEWAPIRDIRFRGSVASAVRAPNIVELFSPQSVNFTTAANDPCDAQVFAAANAAQKAARRITCAAAIPGWNPATFTSNFGANHPSLQLLQGGNPALGPETAETWDLGVVVQPRFIPRLQLSFDFFKYDIHNEVGTIPINTLLQQLCYDSTQALASNPFCALIQRDLTTNSGAHDSSTGNAIGGGVKQVVLTNQNVARVKIEGFDFSAAYAFEISDVLRGKEWGSIALRLDGTDMYNWALQGLPGQVYTQFANTINNATPRWKVTGTAQWTYDRLSVGWTTHFIGSMIANNGVLITSLAPAYTGDYYEHDLRGTYKFSDDIEFRAGVLNITNKYPPYLPETFAGTGTGSSAFSNIGRFFYVGATLRH
ncbi:MAG: TonB-dependent receptor [Phenylobacterium sp.]|nr:MAG: TonB-dependent receptor [Phenylobacterium sp.]